MDEQRKLLISGRPVFSSVSMLKHAYIAGAATIHQRLHKVQKKLNNDAVDAMAFAMAMMWEPGCIVIKEEHDS